MPRQRRRRHHVPLSTSSDARADIGVHFSTANTPFEAELERQLAGVVEQPGITINGVDADVRVEIPVRFQTHEPSVHIVRAPDLAQKMPLPDVPMPLVRADLWVAPCQEQASLEGLIAQAHDLRLERIDVALFVEQFTPADPALAFCRRYGWWAACAVPFTRWQSRSTATRTSLLDRLRDKFRVWQSLRRKPVIAVEHAEEQAPHQVEATWEIPEVVPVLHIGRVMLVFGGLLIGATLPAAAVSLSHSLQRSAHQIQDQGQRALQDVRLAWQSDGSARTENLHEASARFAAAQRALSQVNGLLTAFAQTLPQAQAAYADAQLLLRVGDEASQSASLLSRGVDEAFHGKYAHTDERILALEAALEGVLPRLTDIRQALDRVNPSVLPATVRASWQVAPGALVQTQASLREIHALADALVAFVGHDRPRHYLFVFQNPAELRPTGGFMGSLAEIILDRGDVKHIFFPGGGPYDLRSQLLARVAPPEPIRLLGARWELQDANWFPDFPAAAQKIRWFWSAAQQPTLDGVIAVNASVLQNLLQITGPIDVPEFRKTFTSANVLDVLQTSVEVDYDKQENQPKKIVGVLLQRILARLKILPKEQWLQAAQMFASAFEQKDVQVWMANPEEERLVEDWGWNGRLKAVSGDALAVVEANLGGQKTDRVIAERVSHAAAIQPDGQIIDTLTLERTHHGKKGAAFEGVNNVSYVRVYVPQGSELLAAEGFNAPTSSAFKLAAAHTSADPDLTRIVHNTRTGAGGTTVTDEFGRTAFGGWLQLKPGEHTLTTFRYRLPFTAFDLARALAPTSSIQIPEQAAYSVLFTSQSGKPERELTSRILIPSDWRARWAYDPSATSTVRQASSAPEYAGAWDRDRVIAALFTAK